MKTTGSKPSSALCFRAGKLITGSQRSLSTAKVPGAVRAPGPVGLQPSSLQGKKVSMQAGMEELAMRSCQAVREGSGQHPCDLSICPG